MGYFVTSRSDGKHNPLFLIGKFDPDLHIPWREKHNIIMNVIDNLPLLLMDTCQLQKGDLMRLKRYYLKKYFPLKTLREIGEMTGTDHSSVVASINCVQKNIRFKTLRHVIEDKVKIAMVNFLSA